MHSNWRVRCSQCALQALVSLTLLVSLATNCVIAIRSFSSKVEAIPAVLRDGVPTWFHSLRSVLPVGITLDLQKAPYSVPLLRKMRFLTEHNMRNIEGVDWGVEDNMTRFAEEGSEVCAPAEGGNLAAVAAHCIRIVLGIDSSRRRFVCGLRRLQPACDLGAATHSFSGRSAARQLIPWAARGAPTVVGCRTGAAYTYCFLPSVCSSVPCVVTITCNLQAGRTRLFT